MRPAVARLLRIRTRAEFDRLLEEPLAIVFKHSTACPLSARAHSETERFLEENPEQRVYEVHVIEDRALSDHISSRTGIEHASPQALILKSGLVSWHDAHFGVSAQALRDGIE